jgi:hypothetical protein
MNHEPEQPAGEPEAPVSKAPGLFRNPVSLVGAALGLVSLANIVFLFLIDVVAGRPSPYIGIFAYMVMPAFLILGLLIIPLGMWIERRRRRKLQPGEVPRYPRIDLNNPAQRNAFTFFVAFVAVFVILSAVGSYRAYEFTDSVEFCGQLCHKVMHPEFAAYQASPHARVRCVDCHVGPGATWYVRSKLSGARQVYAVLFNKFPRPIPTPVHDLRPAQETCEQCHWPKRFYGAQLKIFNHYGYDEKNSPRQIQMLINTGGGDPTLGATAGIHWHMNIANEIWYIPSDRQQQIIPWVRVKDSQGRITEYMAKDAKLGPDQIEKAQKFRMDCITCHNRPTHIYVPPDRSVDQAIFTHKIDVNLPFIKQQAVTALTKDYKTEQEAMEGIATDIDGFYLTKYPQVHARSLGAIKQAIAESQRIFQTTIFPDMKVDWRTHPDNIGHFYFAGCFRCHDGNHVSKEGLVVRKDCTICHTILAQPQAAPPLMQAVAGVPFKHPVDIGDISAMSCSDCHTGGVGPSM